MNIKAPVITIDGPSGSGKGTIAGILAKRLGWCLLDSGALYRLLAFAARNHGVRAVETTGAHLYQDLRRPRFRCIDFLDFQPVIADHCRFHYRSPFCCRSLSTAMRHVTAPTCPQVRGNPSCRDGGTINDRRENARIQ